jgi:hypothetical protein
MKSIDEKMSQESFASNQLINLTSVEDRGRIILEQLRVL